MSRNRLPTRLKDQILGYVCLRFKAENLNQFQLIEQLPNSIYKSICQHLFLPTIEKVYLFRGLSTKTLLLFVSIYQLQINNIFNENLIIEVSSWNDLSYINELKMMCIICMLLEPFISLTYGLEMVSPDLWSVCTSCFSDYMLTFTISPAWFSMVSESNVRSRI